MESRAKKEIRTSFSDKLPSVRLTSAVEDRGGGKIPTSTTAAVEFPQKNIKSSSPPPPSLKKLSEKERKKKSSFVIGVFFFLPPFDRQAIILENEEKKEKSRPIFPTPFKAEDKEGRNEKEGGEGGASPLPPFPPSLNFYAGAFNDPPRLVCTEQRANQRPRKSLMPGSRSRRQTQFHLVWALTLTRGRGGR